MIEGYDPTKYEYVESDIHVEGKYEYKPIRFVPTNTEEEVQVAVYAFRPQQQGTPWGEIDPYDFFPQFKDDMRLDNIEKRITTIEKKIDKLLKILEIKLKDK